MKSDLSVLSNLKVENGHDDKLLWEAVFQGDTDAFTQIYRKYWYNLFRTAYFKTGRKDKAEEIVQDIFTRLWKERRTLHITSLGSYLFSAVRYEIIDHYRSKVVHHSLDETLQDLADMEDSETENTIFHNDLVDTINKGLFELPEKSREVFRLSRLQQWSNEKIAQHLDLSEKAVEYHLTKALKHLRTYLADSFAFLLILLGV